MFELNFITLLTHLRKNNFKELETMSEDLSHPVLVNEDTILAYTHDKRKSIVTQLLAKPDTLNDPDQTKIVLSALKDMDTAALGRKRIKVEEKASLNQEATAGLIARLLAATSSIKPYQSDIPSNKAAPVLGADIPEPVLVIGETSVIGATQQSYETFVASVS